MYIIKNALKNLTRNKGRNILLGIIIFALILATTVALVINTTGRSIIDDYKTRFGSKVTLSVDFDKLMADQKPNADGSFMFPQPPEISSEQYMAFAESKHLKSYQLNMVASIAFPKLKAIDDDSETEQNTGGSIGQIGSLGGDEDYMMPKAKLISYSDTNNLPDFKDGTRKIISGNIYKEKNECIVSSDFAKLNNLKIGDTFQITETESKKNITLKVAGIFADATKTSDLPEGVFLMEKAFSNRRNEILVSTGTLRGNFNAGDLTVTAEYELKNPELLEDFEKELRGKGLPDAYNVETDEAGYNKIIAPVEGLSKISVTFMWVVLAVGGIIILFITTLTIRERKYEIGVLRAMGMKKLKVAVMLVTETIMITALCLGAGLGIGSVISQPVADTLIAAQAEATQNNPQTGGQPGFNGSISFGGDSGAEPLTEIEVSLSPTAALQIASVALLLALLSSAAGVIFITKYEPMKILSERN